MHLGKTLLILLAGASLAAAGPGSYITIVNDSPYDWKLTYSHEYQMDWKPTPLIQAGTSVVHYVEYFYTWGDKGDDGAEAVYQFVGCPEPASFRLQARQNGGKRIEVQYLESLSSVNNPANSLINLGFQEDGGEIFVLAGDGTQPYVSTNPPIGWMQATLSTIGSKALRQISMPASHDSGMSELTRSYGGVSHNTVTQSRDTYQQLVHGARWFDIRPVHRKGKWYTGHLTDVAIIGKMGGMGRMIPDIVSDFNKFTSLSPGEFMVLDISHEMDCGNSKWADTLTPEQWQLLYMTLGSLKDLWVPNDGNIPDDLSSVPMSTFIQPGSKSAVFIRLPDYAPPINQTFIKLHSNSNMNIPQSAFILGSHLPFDGTYSNTQDMNVLSTDQISKLQAFRLRPDSQIERSTWTITQQASAIFDVGNWWKSIIGLATYARRELYVKIWPAMTKTTYPNLIEVDDIHDSQLTALCMAINFNSGSTVTSVGTENDMKHGGRIEATRI